jgi:hypothetical protein
MTTAAVPPLVTRDMRDMRIIASGVHRQEHSKQFANDSEREEVCLV